MSDPADFPDPDERAAAELLRLHRPTADPALRRRGRVRVRTAMTRLRLRHQAQLLLATGWVAIALAALVVAFN